MGDIADGLLDEVGLAEQRGVVDDPLALEQRAKPIQLKDGTILAGTSIESYRNWTPYVDRSADDGVTFVLRASAEFEVLARNPLGEGVYASPAFSDGELFLRGAKHLFCISRRE